MGIQRRHRDTAHHHPSVYHAREGWVWECACGGASRRAPRSVRSWRQAVIEALVHADALAP